MATLAEKTLSRLRTCQYAGLQVTPDLLEDAIFVFETFTRKDRMRVERDAMIRRVALVHPDATTWELAALLSAETKRMNRTRNGQNATLHDDAPTSVRACLQAAQNYYPLPGSQRQFYRVLKERDTPASGNDS